MNETFQMYWDGFYWNFDMINEWKSILDGLVKKNDESFKPLISEIGLINERVNQTKLPDAVKQIKDQNEKISNEIASIENPQPSTTAQTLTTSTLDPLL